MDYTLKKRDTENRSYFSLLKQSVKQFWTFLAGEKSKISLVAVLVLFNSGAAILTPFLIATFIDKFITQKDLSGLIHGVLWLLVLYITSSVTNYFQTRVVGGISQRTLWRLRDTLFKKLQALPIAFFKRNKAGDLMSRLNSDTDKLNQFLSEGLVRFIGSFFSIFGIAVFILFINLKLALVTLSALILIFIVTRVLSPIIQRTNKRSLTALGALSSEIQEGLSNFKVIAAFNQRAYLNKKLAESNQANFKLTSKASMLNRAFEPLYSLSNSLSQIAVLTYGIWLIMHGQLTVGFLIGFIAYARQFYEPLQILASIWGMVQVALAAWSRVQEVLDMKGELITISSNQIKFVSKGVNDVHSMEFKNVSFAYDDAPDDLKLIDINLDFKKGKTYAIVGPTGGGKTTIATLMARLYDATSGEVKLLDRDIRTYTSDELAEKIGYILQEPFLFTDSLGDNIRYGNAKLANLSNTELEKQIRDNKLGAFLDRFENGLDTLISDSAQNISLGQKQIISFIRIFLRQPELFILDEATANVDTVTETVLEEIMDKMPASTTKIIIAHRLNTIRYADEIVFINAGRAQKALNFDDAIKLIDSSKSR